MTATFNPFAEVVEALRGQLQGEISEAGCSCRFGGRCLGPWVSSRWPEGKPPAAQRREYVGLSWCGDGCGDAPQVGHMALRVNALQRRHVSEAKCMHAPKQ